MFAFEQLWNAQKITYDLTGIFVVAAQTSPKFGRLFLLVENNKITENAFRFQMVQLNNSDTRMPWLQFTFTPFHRFVNFSKFQSVYGPMRESRSRFQKLPNKVSKRVRPNRPIIKRRFRQKKKTRYILLSNTGQQCITWCFFGKATSRFRKLSKLFCL